MIVPARQIGIEMGIVDDGRTPGVEQVGPRRQIDILEFGIADDHQLLRLDTVRDQLIDDLATGHEAAIEAAVIGMVADAAIAGAMGHLGE